MEHLITLIPAANLPAVENALQQTFNTTEVKEIALLTGGLSGSAVFKIMVNDQHYVLKLDIPVTSNNDDLSACMEIAAEAGIAPPVYYLNKAEGVSITGFIKHIPMQDIFKSPEVLLPKLAQTIRSIHELPLFPTENNLLETVDQLINQFKESTKLAGVVFEECFAYYEEIKEYYPWEDMEKVSSHNDINPNNMVFDGEKIWIIDWDAAFKNDRYVDLSIVANFYVANDDQENTFLEAYFGNNMKDYNKARFFLMRQVCRIVWAMLMFKLADGTKPMDIEHDSDMSIADLKEVRAQIGNGKLSLATYQGQLLFGKALLNEAVKNMRLPRFSLSINHLRIVKSN